MKELVQDIPQLGLDGGGGNPNYADHRYKRVRYTYDLVSGNVLRVDYGRGDDQMHHRYAYDADNRITEVETSADGEVWHQDAEYFYYPHGPLERVEFGEYKVQGMDYAYTLQGWLKGINSERLTPMNDMGRDGVGVPTNPNGLVGRDAFGESIGYYGDEDYSAINAMRWGTPGPFSGTSVLRSCHSTELLEQRRRYLRENPIRAGLVNDETAYMWSSANPHLGFECDEG